MYVYVHVHTCRCKCTCSCMCTSVDARARARVRCRVCVGLLLAGPCQLLLPTCSLTSPPSYFTGSLGCPANGYTFTLPFNVTASQKECAVLTLEMWIRGAQTCAGLTLRARARARARACSCTGSGPVLCVYPSAPCPRGDASQERLASCSTAIH